MNDLDTLRPEVREAVHAIDHGNGVFVDSDDSIGAEKWRIVLAELLRLADECDELRTAYTSASQSRNHWRECVGRAEAELAALKADHAVLQELCEGTVRANLALGHVEEEWQPISTAPHEQLLLLFCPYRHSSNPQRIEVGAATWGERVGQRSNRGAHAWATHWMPLPPPPSVEE